jgi:type I restriction enzyme S subunit
MTGEMRMRLSDLCDFVAVQIDPASRADDVYVGLEHIAPGRFVRTSQGKASDVQSGKYVFQAGDVLYGKLRPYLDKAVLATDAGICTTELLVLRPKEGVDPRFLVSVVHAPSFVEHAVAGTTGVQHPRTSWNHIRDFELPDFEANEQTKTASLLWEVHDTIVANDAVVEAGADLKRAAMRTLFTRGLRGEAQKETEIGPVPESWAIIPYEQIFKLTSGKTRPNDLVALPSGDQSFPVLGGNGVMGYSSRWFLDAPAILVIGRVGEYCGATHVTSGKVWITDNALYAKEWLNPDAELPFVGAFLEYFDLNRFKRMAGQPLVTQGMIYEHSIPLPSPDEQREIVAIFDAIDRKIDLHRRKRAVLDELFKSLLHKLMTGEIRIADLDISALNRAAPVAEVAA